MENAGKVLELIFLLSSAIANFARAYELTPALAWVYISFLCAYGKGWLRLQGQPTIAMFHSPLSAFNLFIFVTLQLSRLSNAQPPTSLSPADGLQAASDGSSVTASPSLDISGTPTSFRSVFTVPAAADIGANLIPNIVDPEAVDAQTVCPGYKASHVIQSPLELSASLALAGPACNVYGNDIENLNLTVQYQSTDRLAVRIVPSVLDSSNASYYNLPNNIVLQPTTETNANSTNSTNDLSFVWSNDPTFSFSVYRASTGDSLFSTAGTKLIFEDQFIEFASALPENYNLYGLGETIHGLRLGNNFTKTMYAADVGDPVDL